MAIIESEEIFNKNRSPIEVVRKTAGVIKRTAEGVAQAREVFSAHNIKKTGEAAKAVAMKRAVYPVVRGVGFTFVGAAEIATLKGVKILGRENLDEVVRMQQEGVKIVAAFNHSDYLDPLVVRKGLRQLGLKDFDSQMTYLVGQSPRDNKAAALFLDALTSKGTVINVWQKRFDSQSEEDESKRRRVNFKAFKSAKEALGQGRMIGIFPEGTRGKNGLQKGIPEVAHYFELSDVVFPVAIDWVQKFGKKDGKRQKGVSRVIFGQPIQTEALLQNADSSSREKRNEGVVDGVMKAIADLLPESKRGEYK